MMTSEEKKQYKMMTTEEKKQYNQKCRLEAKDHTIKRIVTLARAITACGGGNIKFVKCVDKGNKK